MCRDDVETITANPKTAGVARWNFLALWGAHMARGHQAALDYTTKACRPAGIYSPLLPFLFSCIVAQAQSTKFAASPLSG